RYVLGEHGRWLLFFCQAEDGIRDFHVTGVQTCALPICLFAAAFDLIMLGTTNIMTPTGAIADIIVSAILSAVVGGVIGWWLGRRSEERRVGKECRVAGGPTTRGVEPRRDAADAGRTCDV